MLSLHKLYLDSILHHVTHILDTLQDVIDRHVPEHDVAPAVLRHVDSDQVEWDLSAQRHMNAT